jgi:hypothetical protein
MYNINFVYIKVFTCQVPWVAGNGKSEEELKVHNMAKDWMEKKGELYSNLLCFSDACSACISTNTYYSGTHKAPHVGSVEKFQDDLGLGEEELYCFTVDGCYPSKEDVCQGLGKYRVGVIACFVLHYKKHHLIHTIFISQK